MNKAWKIKNIVHYALDTLKQNMWQDNWKERQAKWTHKTYLNHIWFVVLQVWASFIIKWWSISSLGLDSQFPTPHCKASKHTPKYKNQIVKLIIMIIMFNRPQCQQLAHTKHYVRNYK
jgi:hypothetical protein